MSISVTECAAERIKHFLDNRESGIGIKIGVKTTGCSGLAYKIEYVDHLLDTDLEYTSNGVRIFVAQDHVNILNGIVLDFVTEGMQSGFKFTNPNVKATCGCGESFTV